MYIDLWNIIDSFNPGSIAAIRATCKSWHSQIVNVTIPMRIYWFWLNYSPDIVLYHNKTNGVITATKVFCATVELNMHHLLTSRISLSPEHLCPITEKLIFNLIKCNHKLPTEILIKIMDHPRRDALLDIIYAKNKCIFVG